MEYLWTGFKALLSTVLMAIAIVIALAANARDGWGDPMTMGAIVFFVFLAFLPWAPALLGESRWGGAAVCVFVAAICAFCTYQGYVNGFGSSDCSARRRKLYCQLLNAIQEALGPFGLTLLGVAVSAYMLWTAGTLLKKSS